MYRSSWSSAYNQSFPLDATACKQRAWDKLIVKDEINHLFTTASQQNKFRLLAVISSHSSNWLHALPIASCSLRLENEDIRVAVGLCLGVALCQAHQYPCRTLVKVKGLHGLSCKFSSGKHSRYTSINNIIYRACCRSDIPALKKPTGLTRTDGKYPNSSLVLWSAGKCVLWDVKIAGTMAPSYSTILTISSGLDAEQSSARKLTKYSELVISHNCYGHIRAGALTFLSEFGRRMSVVTRNMRETTFLFQSLCVAIQRFNYVLYESPFIDGKNKPESFLFK